MAHDNEGTAFPAETDLLGSLEYRAVFDAVPDGIAIVDHEGRIRQVNAQFEELFGYSKRDLVGQPVEILVPAPVVALHQEHRTRYRDDPYPRPMGAGLYLEGVRRDGSTVPVEVSLSPLRIGEGDFVICSVRDVTDRHRLRRFSVGTLQAAENERLRVAQELHDDTAQQLSALLLRLHVARGIKDPSVRDEKLAELREAIQACADGVRRIARGLRPPALLDAGVAAAIRAYLNQVGETTDLIIEVRADPVEDLLDLDSKLVLYRIVQEAVANAVRHAHADSLTVTVTRWRDRVDAVVQDNGRGFVVAALSDGARGLGLVGMEERAASVGGRVAVESTPGKGTRVRVEIPKDTKDETHGA